MSNEQEIKEIQKQVEEIRKNKREVKESFAHVPDIQAKILRDLDSHERYLLDVMKKKQAAKDPDANAE